MFPDIFNLRSPLGWSLKGWSERLKSQKESSGVPLSFFTLASGRSKDLVEAGAFRSQSRKSGILPGERTVAGQCSMEHRLRIRACRLKNPSGMIGWAGHNNCSSALIGGYGYLSVKWEQTQKFAPILFFVAWQISVTSGRFSNDHLPFLSPQ